MNSLQKRFLLFIFGCIGLRLLLVYIAKSINTNYLPLLGYLALLPAIGFILIYLTGARPSGPEVFGDYIWWNSIRPIHAALYFLFAFMAINKNKNSWIVLLADVLLGLSSFTFFHYSNGNILRVLN